MLKNLIGAKSAGMQRNLFSLKLPLGLSGMLKCLKYCIRTNIGGYNIWRFVEIMDLARY